MDTTTTIYLTCRQQSSDGCITTFTRPLDPSAFDSERLGQELLLSHRDLHHLDIRKCLNQSEHAKEASEVIEKKFQARNVSSFTARTGQTESQDPTSPPTAMLAISGNPEQILRNPFVPRWDVSETIFPSEIIYVNRRNALIDVNNSFAMRASQDIAFENCDMVLAQRLDGEKSDAVAVGQDRNEDEPCLHLINGVQFITKNGYISHPVRFTVLLVVSSFDGKISKPLNVLLDTGADRSMIIRSMADRLGGYERLRGRQTLKEGKGAGNGNIKLLGILKAKLATDHESVDFALNLLVAEDGQLGGFDVLLSGRVCFAAELLALGFTLAPPIPIRQDMVALANSSFS